MKIPALGGKPAEQRRQIYQPLGDEVENVAAAVNIALPHAVHGQQFGVNQLAALAFAQRLPDDDIDGAGFVFERDKSDAVRGLRLLAHQNDAVVHQT